MMLWYSLKRRNKPPLLKHMKERNKLEEKGKNCIECWRRTDRVEEAQREALELQQKEEERPRGLKRIQLQKDEAIRRKKLEEKEEEANHTKLPSKNKSWH